MAARARPTRPGQTGPRQATPAGPDTVTTGFVHRKGGNASDAALAGATRHFAGSARITQLYLVILMFRNSTVDAAGPSKTNSVTM
jgi:hypothetical protein